MFSLPKQESGGCTGISGRKAVKMAKLMQTVTVTRFLYDQRLVTLDSSESRGQGGCTTATPGHGLDPRGSG